MAVPECVTAYACRSDADFDALDFLAVRIPGGIAVPGWIVTVHGTGAAYGKKPVLIKDIFHLGAAFAGRDNRAIRLLCPSGVRPGQE